MLMFQLKVDRKLKIRIWDVSWKKNYLKKENEMSRLSVTCLIDEAKVYEGLWRTMLKK